MVKGVMGNDKMMEGRSGNTKVVIASDFSKMGDED